MQNKIIITKKFKDILAFTKTFILWRKQISCIKAYSTDSPKLIIIPCDPWTIGGSRGDEAMLVAVIQSYRKKYGNIPVEIVTGSETGNKYINSLPISRLSYIYTWFGAYPANKIYNECIAHSPSHIVILGADCMDGFYSPLLSLNLLALHDLFSRTPGIESRLMGFSFNDKPNWMIVKAFHFVKETTRLNARDEISYKRFISKTGIKCGLVSDIAFMLEPTYNFTGYNKLQLWTKKCRDNGYKIILGFNFHPMLRKYKDSNDIHNDAIILSNNLKKILKDNKSICFVLIPHDERNGLTDNIMLNTIYSEIYNAGFSDRIYYDNTVYRAAEIKGLCSLIDGIVSSRMHLAIAALGQGKSVLAASYQGKFEGLFKFFKLPKKYILAPNVFISSEMTSIFNDYIENIDILNETVHNNIVGVLELSKNNLQ